MRWLLDREERDREQLQAVLEGKLPASSLRQLPAQDATPPNPPSTGSTTTEEEPDWFAAYDQQKAEREALQRLKEEVAARNRREEKLKKLREDYGNTKRWQQKRKVRETIHFSRVKGSHDHACTHTYTQREVSPPTEPPDSEEAGTGGTEDADLVVGEYQSDEEDKAGQNATYVYMY